jgi:acyl-CoA synthetase (AMP-forming)/AMP-acid ligase II
MDTNLLRTWHGEAFDAARLRHLLPELKQSLERSLDEDAARVFLRWYPATGAPLAWTYADFGRQVGGVRSWLETLDLPAMTTICTIEGNSARHLAMVAGVLTSGHTLALIDPDEVTAGLRRKLGVLPSDLLVVSDRTDVPPTCRQVGFPESMPAVAAPPARGAPPCAVRILTSGSTGHAKVVEWPESALLANVEALIRHHHLSAKKTILTPLPLFHVNCLTFSFLASLLSGGTLILMERFDLGRLFEALTTVPVDIVAVVPHVLSLLGGRLPDLAALPHRPDYFVTAAAPLAPKLARKLASELPVPVVQGWGLSEAVNFSCTTPVDATAEERAHWLTGFERPSIGVPLDFNSVHVLADDGREITREGDIGELAVRGWNVMAGYRNGGDDEVFAGDYLHTGDLGCFRRDSRGRPYFFVTGRKKELVKRYGESVSLLEIDELLVTALAPDQAAIAVPFDNQYAGEEIAVLVQANDARTCDLAALVSYMHEQLAEKSRPRLYARTSTPVRTASGKARRRIFGSALTSLYGKQMFGKAPVVLADVLVAGK